MKNYALIGLLSLSSLCTAQNFPAEPARTGVSGVYEVMVGVEDAQAAIAHFELFGFRVIKDETLTSRRSKAIYNVSSNLRSIRMQNADIDAHGLLRILVWENLTRGVGYARPDTPGQRMAAMHTADVVRLVDVFKDERALDKPWLIQEPVLDSIYQAETAKPGLHNRRVTVRETGIWGDWFNHVFFQRYGYDLPGYGYINQDAVFRTSEFTHHSFILDKPLDESVTYYVNALGFKPEQKAPIVDGEWQPGPAAVFAMPPGHSHQYIGMVSPNNISGKLKFFYPYDRESASRASLVLRNARGISMHSLFVNNLNQVKNLLRQEGIETGAIVKNEFGESSFVFTGPDGAHWQILKLDNSFKTKPVTEFNLVPVNH